MHVIRIIYVMMHMHVIRIIYVIQDILVDDRKEMHHHDVDEIRITCIIHPHLRHPTYPQDKVEHTVCGVMITSKPRQLFGFGRHLCCVAAS